MASDVGAESLQQNIFEEEGVGDVGEKSKANEAMGVLV